LSRVDPGLEVVGIRKRFGDLRAVDDLSFDVRRGEVFGFVGSNGAGKSTTMRIVLGVLRADGGEVRFAGKPLDFAARRRIGYMPEERGLYPRMPIAEQLIYSNAEKLLNEEASVFAEFLKQRKPAAA